MKFMNIKLKNINYEMSKKKEKYFSKIFIKIQKKLIHDGCVELRQIIIHRQIDTQFQKFGMNFIYFLKSVFF